MWKKKLNNLLEGNNLAKRANQKIGRLSFIKKTNMKEFLLLLFICITQIAYGQPIQKNIVSYVDPLIGTDNSKTPTASLFGSGDAEKGQVIPAVLFPNGMNFWTAQTEDTEQKSIAPYYYKSTSIQGFRNSHWLNGGCTQDYGTMTLMPLYGILKCQPKERASSFTHSEETSTPYYYSVYLKDDQIKAEMTGTSRTGIFRFTYTKVGDGYLVVNPNNDKGEGYIEYDAKKNEIRGYNPVYRIYQGWGKPAGFSGYFVVTLNKKIENFGSYQGGSRYADQAMIEKKPNIGIYLHFKVKTGEKIIVKVSSSFTDFDGADKNMKAEMNDWNFDAAKENLHKTWKNHLGSIEVKGKDKDTKCQFYSALYRYSFLPHVINDVDGRYPAFSKGKPIMKTKDHNYYDDFSLWDTYRALHPLLNIIEPQKSGEMIQSLLNKYEQGGWLPIFPCWNSYTSEMIGDHCTSLIGDAFAKGITNFNQKEAYQAMRQNAFEQPSTYEQYKDGLGRRALNSYLKYGYIPLEDSVKEAFHQGEQVSRTLEYAYDDYVLSLMAKAWGHKKDAEALTKRAQYYKNVINPKTGYVQGRYKNGEFLHEDNATKFCSFITEGTPCHYTWYVPQDIKGLMNCMGGKQPFILRLDSMFSEKRYWHGNEPCHQIAYLYNYAGEPWKTQRTVRHILETEYHKGPSGLSGNDDAGQMSAWYIFSALGFYPVCPGTPYYIIGTPIFKKTTIRLNTGKSFTIIANHVSKNNIYIQSVKLNGKKYLKNYISHKDITTGGVLQFEMGNIPNKLWGSSSESCPPSLNDSESY